MKTRILATFGFNRTAPCATQPHIIRRRADVVWPPRSFDLTPLDYNLWGSAKDKCYAAKPETIDALKLHTINNVILSAAELMSFGHLGAEI